jgi:hypothetical protein
MSREVPFFSQTAVLERYIHSSNPADHPGALAVIIEVLRTKPDLRRWFFANRPHPRWAEILLEHNLLGESPEPVATERGVLLPRWDAQDYLVSVAGEVPGVVLAHFESIRTNNNYLPGAITAMCLIPMKQADQAIPKLIECLTDTATAFRIAEETFELMKKLAQAHFTNSAFALCEALTNPQPSPRAKKSDNDILGDYVFNAEAISFLPIDDYYEDQLWKPGLEELAALDLKRLVSLLEKQLIRALRVEAETKGRPGEEREHSFWRQAIEDTGQDSSDVYKDSLLKWLRRFVKLFVERQPNEASASIDKYLSSEYEILKRLAIYVIGQFPQQYSNQVREILFNVENMDDVWIHHEYFKLLESGYSHLKSTDQRRLEELILAGPVSEKLAKVAARVDEERGQNPEEYARVYSECWKRDRLWMIRGHLRGETAAKLQDLTTEFEEPAHPDFTSWSTGAHFVATVSPANANEIGAMPLQELLTYLREWRPGDRMHRFEEEEYGALGEVVAKVVFSNYEKYRDHLAVIARLNPEYATSFINYPPSNTLSSDDMFRIKISLGEELLADKALRTDNTSSYEGGWVGFRFAMVNYLEKFFEKDSTPIPVDDLPRVRALLILLTDDPDPLPDADQPPEGWFGHKDPATVAINHVRPEALSTLIAYARHKTGLDIADDRRGFGPKRLELEVKQTLTKKVNYHLDRSTALHSIFGKHFNLLCWLDWNWTVEHLNEIFPNGDDEMSVGFFAAAWDSFVLNSKIYKPVFSLLRGKYERAIELHKQGFNTQTHLDPVSHFASHLAVEFLYADYSLNTPEGQSSLLARFFKETAAQSRATAARSAVDVFINLSQNEDNGDHFWQRIRALWQWRLEEAGSRNHPSDFDGEMQSFSRLLSSSVKHESAASLWPLLEGMLHYVARSPHRAFVWWNFEHYLLLEVERDPVKAIQVFRLMHDQVETARFYYRNEARKIIEVGVQHAESRHETLLLIEQISKSGNYSFRDVYDRYVNDGAR